MDKHTKLVSELVSLQQSYEDLVNLMFSTNPDAVEVYCNVIDDIENLIRENTN